jgi:hypothetical protein
MTIGSHPVAIAKRAALSTWNLDTAWLPEFKGPSKEVILPCSIVAPTDAYPLISV